jgi:hypothetical protein
VEFDNPYCNPGWDLLYNDALTQHRMNGESDADAKKHSEEDANKLAKGEQGSNVIYLGEGTAGMKDDSGNDAAGQGLVFSIYSKQIYTISAYENHMMSTNDRTNRFQTVARVMKPDSGTTVRASAFQIIRVRSVNDPYAL